MSPANHVPAENWPLRYQVRISYPLFLNHFANSILATRPCHTHTSPPQPDIPSRKLQQVPEVSQLHQVPRNLIYHHDSCNKSPKYYSFTKSKSTARYNCNDSRNSINSCQTRQTPHTSDSNSPQLITL
jgi:hypothetical protein